MGQTLDEFIAKWERSEAQERANFPGFLTELCDVLGVEHPGPGGPESDYCFERPVKHHEIDKSVTNRIDLYKRDHLILEAKQGSHSDADRKRMGLPARRDIDKSEFKTGYANQRGSKAWTKYMAKARDQAEGYVRDLPDDHTPPPFVIVCDVGYCFDIYANFNRSGKAYQPFTVTDSGDKRHRRIFLDQLRDDRVLDDLRQVFQAPLTLDPAIKSERVTKEISQALGKLAQQLEVNNPPTAVATFLSKCLFSMFAEDVGLLPDQCFTKLLEEHKGDPQLLAGMLGELWQQMNAGGFSAAAKGKVRHFNGWLFKDTQALILEPYQWDALHTAAKADWRFVEPSIFGTLLEQALDPRERHKLGAHYTPRAYVERLVEPTILEPLRDDWINVKAEAIGLEEAGKTDEAAKTVTGFLRELQKVRVLDPACGSGNFLYVAMDLMKGLEREVIAYRETLADQSDMEALEGRGFDINPANFLGIEINKNAADIAQMVLWIGYLQLWLRDHQDLPGSVPEPILRDARTIECADALMTWERKELRRDKDGKPITRWDGFTMMTDPVTGREVPDPSAQVESYDYIGAKQNDWPECDFIVGNPPFIGNKRMRNELGDGYIEALRSSFPKNLTSSDFVMYWWLKSIRKLEPANSKRSRIGLISTNSINQPFNRRVLQDHLDTNGKGLNVRLAIPDHPWVKGNAADVRICMLVVQWSSSLGELVELSRASSSANFAQESAISLETKYGRINADLTVGADTSSASNLISNKLIAHQGLILVGEGFRIPENIAQELISANPKNGIFLPQYQNGIQFIKNQFPTRVIDFFGLSCEQARIEAPHLFQWLLENVYPTRKQNRDKNFRENWWLFGRQRPEFRKGVKSLSSFIGTCRTTKHRVFCPIDSYVIPDAKLIAICLGCNHQLSILSSAIHLVWSQKTGGWLGVGNDSTYNHSSCFDTFPFPDLDGKNELRARLDDLGERLDRHRKDRQAEHDDLTLTQMYNVLEAMREGRALTDKEREINAKGLVSTLKQIHDEIDVAVAEAYGWPADLSDGEILERVLALNLERAAEEARGHIRWLRPEFQNPDGVNDAKPVDAELGLAAPDKAIPAAQKAAWPKDTRGRLSAVRDMLADVKAPITVDGLRARFKGARANAVEESLELLVAASAARNVGNGLYVGR